MYWIDPQGDDPALNLALEEILLGRMEPGHPGFAMLWQNRPTVVVGRFQNARAEINAAYVREHGIAVARRMTGGGAVYHDVGTLNYSFIRALDTGSLPTFREAVGPVAATLRSLGIPVTFSGRNDIMLNGRKVGGMAYCRRGKGFLHHGCLLVNTDLEALAQALTVDPEKFRSKGVASVRARVGNLAEARPPEACPLTAADLRAALLAGREGVLHTPTPADMAEARRLRDEKYASPDWIYGASPPFTERKTRRFPWGRVDALFEVRDGRVADCHVYGDFFMTEHEGHANLNDLERALTGLAYTPEAMRPVLDRFPLAAMFSGCDATELIAFFLPD